jgi:hypothetical protein
MVCGRAMGTSSQEWYEQASKQGALAHWRKCGPEPVMVPLGGPRAFHGDDLHGNQWRGGGGNFARHCEVKDFTQCKGGVKHWE